MSEVERKYEDFKIGEIIPRGWIYEQLRRDRDGFVGHLDELANEEVGSRIFISNDSKEFIDKNMQNDKEHNWWNGESEGNWLDAIINLAYLLDSEELKQKIHSYVSELLRVKGDESYLGVYPSGYRYVEEFIDGELWTQSRIILAMLSYYTTTNNSEVLELIKKAADKTVEICTKKFKTSGIFNYRNLNAWGHGLMIVEPMLKLYSITGNARYVEFAIWCYEDYSSQEIISLNVGSDCQLNNLLNPDGIFKGHGVHTCEHLRIPLLLYHYTGIEKYRVAYKNAFQRIKNYLTISGACVSDEMIGLPLSTAGYEYCALTELLISYLSIIELAGELEFADLAEKLLFNAAQASRSHDGKSIAYLSADNVLYATGEVRKMPPRWCYSPTHKDAAVCCAPNAGRILPYFVNKMWLRTADRELVAMFYGPCVLKTTINNSDINIEEITSYPFEDSVRISISTGKETRFQLRLRIPPWAESVDLKLNERVFNDYIKDNGFLVIDRLWKDKDILELSFKSNVRILESIDHTIAIAKGPLIYSLRIPETGRVRKTYSLGGFYDIDYYPKKDSKELWNYTLQIDSLSNIGDNFYPSMEDMRLSLFPWETSPISICTVAVDCYGEYKLIKLVPIGCTVLRRTTFPYIIGYRNKSRYYFYKESC